MDIPILKTFSKEDWIDAILIQFQGFYKIKGLCRHPSTAVQEQAHEIIQNYRDWYLWGAKSLYGEEEDYRKKGNKEAGDVAWVPFY